MISEQEATLTATIKKYRMNKENISPEELKTKYATAFQKLKDRLKKEAEDYMLMATLKGLYARSDVTDMTIDALIEDMKEQKIGKRVGCAVFKHYDIEEVKEICEEQRKRNVGIILKMGGGIKYAD